ncbi:ABC transporter substrate-binding protein [uncultured Prevotella sp.]|uniref:ABC transporter substrate-binding protein n=1 Tax=uncultured Prevotella sp. TaxID=159272 RepID=UPI00262C678B|nr:ABC transporter substrate-binding protein [uncultured Prevotella sp.]
MNKQSNITLLLFSMLITLASCRGNSTEASYSGDTIRLKYAKQLQIIKCEDYTVVTLNDPWKQGKTLHTYILVPSDKKLPSNLPQGTIVRTPLQRAVITTSVHCGLIMSFGKHNNIKGVCDVKYINIPWIQQQCKDKKIADCGNGITPTLEKIIEINADAILISPFQNSGGYGRLNEWKKPIIETADYMETSALGRAEWMKFYGMLFGAEKQADSIFNDVETKYNHLKQIAKASKTKHSVIIDKINSSVWYVPGGKSTIGQIIADANASYPFSDEKSSGSLALPFESVLEKAGNSDIWLIRYNSPQKATYKSLLTENSGYAQFKAFKENMVFGCNTYSNTFYEDTPFHPDVLLRDIIIITHPEITTLGETKYFEHIK